MEKQLNETINLSTERKEEIRALALEYFNEIKQIKAPKKDEFQEIFLFEFIDVLEKSFTASCRSDFLLKLTEEISKLSSPSLAEYCYDSRLIQILMEEDFDTALEIFRYLKKAISLIAIQAITNDKYESLFELYRLFQLQSLKKYPSIDCCELSFSQRTDTYLELIQQINKISEIESVYILGIIDEFIEI